MSPSRGERPAAVPAAPGRGRGRTIGVIAAAVGVAALLGGAAFWAYSATASPGEDEHDSAFDGATTEIVQGILEGSTAVTGTLGFADRRTIQSGREGTVTQLPAPGAVIAPGQVLFAIDEVPVFLLRGDLPAWREFATDMSDGPDVRQLEQNLRDLGVFDEEPDEEFRWATVEAILTWQEANGLPETGRLPLGSVVFAAGDLRIADLAVAVGDRVGPGVPIADVTSLTQVVDANVKLADQGLIALGTAVAVRLPGGTDTPGTITSIGTPTEIDATNGQKQTVIPAVVALDDSAAGAGFQQASVTVDIPSERREHVLSVPVDALIAITPQQFGVELVDADGTTRQVPIATGLFAGGRVEIAGDDIRAGQLVVVPRR